MLEEKITTMTIQLDRDMEHKNQQTIAEKIKKYLSFKLKLSPQEEAIAEIIQRVLKTPGTKKLTPGADAYYAINFDSDHYVRVGNGTVAIYSPEGSVMRDVPVSVSDYLRGLILEAVHQDALKIESGIFDNEMKLLQQMESRLPDYAETSSDN